MRRVYSHLHDRPLRSPGGHWRRLEKVGWFSLKDGMIPELCRGDHIGGKTTFEETIIGQSGIVGRFKS